MAARTGNQTFDRIVLWAVAIAVMMTIYWFATRRPTSAYEEAVRQVDHIEIPAGAVVAAPAVVDIALPETDGEAVPAATPKRTEAESAMEPVDKATQDSPRPAPTITRRKADGSTEHVEVLTPDQARKRLRELRRKLAPGSGDGPR